MPSSNPNRPADMLALVAQLSGAPMFPAMSPSLPLGSDPATGILTSTGTAVNNITTATPFATGTLGANGSTRKLRGSMAGRVFLVHAVASGFLMASTSPKVGYPSAFTVASTGTVPPVANTFPGVPLNAGDVREIVMGPQTGWLQWISSSGTASLIVWELF